MDVPPAQVPADDAADFTLTDCRAVLLHVIEELAQHLGHLEITRDVLAAGW